MQFLRDLFLAAIGLPLLILGIGLVAFGLIGFYAGDKAIAGGVVGAGVLCLLASIRVLSVMRRGGRQASAQPKVQQRNWSRSWRDDSATDRQKSFADELGIRYPRNITKGELSDLIDVAMGKRRKAARQGGVGCVVVLLAVVGCLIWSNYQNDSTSKQPTRQPTPPATPAPVPKVEPKPETAEVNKPEEEPTPELRTWTDATRKYKIQARFDGITSGKVKLIKQDGSTVQLPLEKLSKEDQQWIKAKKAGG